MNVTSRARGAKLDGLTDVAGTAPQLARLFERTMHESFPDDVRERLPHRMAG